MATGNQINVYIACFANNCLHLKIYYLFAEIGKWVMVNEFPSSDRRVQIQSNMSLSNSFSSLPESTKVTKLLDLVKTRQFIHVP
jgi:hypothetical protein